MDVIDLVLAGVTLSSDDTRFSFGCGTLAAGALVVRMGTGDGHSTGRGWGSGSGDATGKSLGDREGPPGRHTEWSCKKTRLDWTP